MNLMVKTQNKNKIQELYEELYSNLGKPDDQWSLWCKRPKTIVEKEEIIIGAILTQQVNWKNVDLAINQLKNAGQCSLENIYNLAKSDKNKLADLIKPSGFYKQKTIYLFNISRFFIQNYVGVEEAKNASMDKIRKELLMENGIGPETADSILLYALEKPSFIIDEYTRYLVKRRRLSKNLSYNYLTHCYMDFSVD